MNPREKAFFDDPSAYPEYSLLIKRESLNHAIRIGLHRHRTAALLVLIAVSTAASGAEMPSLFPNVTHGGDGDGAGLAADWQSYVAKGMALDLLARHFEGFVSAVGCTLVVTVVSLLVYPLHLGASPLPPTTMNGNGGVKNTPPSWPSITPVGAAAVATAAIIVAVPSIFIWAVAVWGAGRFHWGFASGVCVGLQSAGLTLKTWSFVHKCYPAAVGWGSPTVAKGFRELSSSPDASYFADGNERPAGSGNANTVAPAGQDPCDGATATPSPRSEYKRSPDLERVATLTFEEFAFFILFAPSLVCEPRLLKRRARRPVDARSVASAASEFFHAGLTYLAVHVYSSALFAPTLRVIAVALHSSWEDVHVWADASGWAALGAEEGSGEWLLGMFRPAAADGDAGEFFTTFAVEGGGGGGSEQQLMVGWTVAAAACFGTFVFSPMMHFLMFYAFWHCVCLGSAELWGYPDRNTYGPWWLVMDDLRDYFRMWSAPVYRWLSASVQRPMLEAARARRRASHRRSRNDDTHAAEKHQRQLAGSTNGTSMSTAAKDEGNGRNRSAPNNDGDDGNGDGGGGGGGGCDVGVWFHISVLCSFLVSSVLHEAVGYVAMRRTFWPFNTFFLVISASSTPSWDLFFPARPAPTAGAAAAAADTMVDGTVAKAAVPSAPMASSGREQGIAAAALRITIGATGRNGATAVAGNEHRSSSDVRAASSVPEKTECVGEGRDGGEKRGRKPAYGVWRGWAAIAFFGVASCPMTLAVHYLCWQWWRCTLMET